MKKQLKEPLKRNKQGYIVEDLTKWKPRFIGEIDPSTLPDKPVKDANICPADGLQCFNRGCGMTHELCMKLTN